MRSASAARRRMLATSTGNNAPNNDLDTSTVSAQVPIGAGVDQPGDDDRRVDDQRRRRSAPRSARISSASRCVRARLCAPERWRRAPRRRPTSQPISSARRLLQRLARTAARAASSSRAWACRPVAWPGSLTVIRDMNGRASVVVEVVGRRTPGTGRCRGNVELGDAVTLLPPSSPARRPRCETSASSRSRAGSSTCWCGPRSARAHRSR